MKRTRSQPNSGTLDRRRFCAVAGVAALATMTSPNTQAEESKPGENPARIRAQTGNGEWTYEAVSGWGQLPAGTIFGGTHGAVATDKAGHVYVSTQSETGILVYTPDGALKLRIATAYPEVHSIFHAEEGADEYLYTTVQKGTPKENWLFVKMKTDGTVVQKISAPSQAGFKAPNQWRVTAAVPGPDGSIFIANGYGDSRIFRFDKNGEFRASYGGRGTADGLFDCSHGLAVDTRYDQPLLLVCDRENRRLCHFDFDGQFVRTITQHLRRPCQVSFHGDYAIVSELEGRVTILDRDNVPVAFLGDNPQKTQWANYQLQPDDIAPALFSAAHGCHIDQQASIYVSDWNQTGRVTKLIRTNT
ncbi:MAG TPA: hypothetical protein VMR02_18375 [Terracidiphilus sp.]|jgi:hypothetical protein|nr:hypothetical protein [Terracidiphilus sp.]